MMVFLDINGIASGKYDNEYMIKWIIDYSNR